MHTKQFRLSSILQDIPSKETKHTSLLNAVGFAKDPGFVRRSKSNPVNRS